MRFRLQELRKERGYSAAALGKLVGASQSTVSTWELNEGRGMSIDSAIAVCRVLHCTLDELTGNPRTLDDDEAEVLACMASVNSAGKAYIVQAARDATQLARFKKRDTASANEISA